MNWNNITSKLTSKGEYLKKKNLVKTKQKAS